MDEAELQRVAEALGPQIAEALRRVATGEKAQDVAESLGLKVAERVFIRKFDGDDTDAQPVEVVVSEGGVRTVYRGEDVLNAPTE